MKKSKMILGAIAGVMTIGTALAFSDSNRKFGSGTLFTHTGTTCVASGCQRANASHGSCDSSITYYTKVACDESNKLSSTTSTFIAD